MNRFLSAAVAITLGLSSCGIARVEGCTEFVEQVQFEPNRTATADRALSYANRWGAPSGWDALRDFGPWWLDLDDLHSHPWWFDPNDLRHFDDCQDNTTIASVMAMRPVRR
jgi:hypothetical protein